MAFPRPARHTLRSLFVTQAAELQLCTRFESAFNRAPGARRRVRLEGGYAEPVYLPDVDGWARIRYREDHFSSALHEVAHWCIAGAAREAQVDYGYWYAPDGRSVEQQALFERVEIGPQALEWLFADLCDHRFHFSADNLNGAAGVSDRFRTAVSARRERWQSAWRAGREAARKAGLSLKAIEVLDLLQREAGSWRRSAVS